LPSKSIEKVQYDNGMLIFQLWNMYVDTVNTAVFTCS
jgi:hypothetical protein